MLLLAGTYMACTKSDDYKKFTAKGEISYTGKLDSVKIMSGNNRVYIRGLFLSDPKSNPVQNILEQQGRFGGNSRKEKICYRYPEILCRKCERRGAEFRNLHL